MEKVYQTMKGKRKRTDSRENGEREMHFHDEDETSLCLSNGVRRQDHDEHRYTFTATLYLPSTYIQYFIACTSYILYDT